MCMDQALALKFITVPDLLILSSSHPISKQQIAQAKSLSRCLAILIKQNLNFYPDIPDN